MLHLAYLQGLRIVFMVFLIILQLRQFPFGGQMKKMS